MPTLRVVIVGRNQFRKQNIRRVKLGENGKKLGETPKMPYPMQKKHQNRCHQTIMIPLVPQSVGFYYG